MEIGIHYDPLLAKIIAHSADRATAIRKLTYALRRCFIAGVETNRDFLLRLLEHPAFQQEAVHTGFIAEHKGELLLNDDEQLQHASLIAVALYLQQQAQAASDGLLDLPPNYRNNPYRAPSIRLQVENQVTVVSWQYLGDERYEVRVCDAPYQATLLSCNAHSVRLILDGLQREFKVLAVDEQFYVQSTLGQCRIKRVPRYPLHQTAAAQGATAAPMPGQVRQVLVNVGAQVSAGAPLIILEAMKMEHTMRATTDGLVEAILVKPGDVVGPGQVLIQLAAAPCS
jgi:propionyl-CoA carboxylase alpha chain